MTIAEMFPVAWRGATHLAGDEIVLVEAPMRPGRQEKRFIGQREKGLGGKGDPENADQEWLSFVQLFFFCFWLLQGSTHYVSNHICIYIYILQLL